MTGNPRDRRRVQSAVGGLGAVAIAIGVFGVPLSSILLLGMFLLCPLMMMRMHGGMGGHCGTKSGDHGPDNQLDAAHSENGVGSTCHHPVRDEETDPK